MQGLPFLSFPTLLYLSRNAIRLTDVYFIDSQQSTRSQILDAMSFPKGLISLCTSQCFPTPVVPGVQFLSINSSLVTNFSGSAPSSQTFNHPTINFTDITICNITIEYTHPSFNDLITVMAWLPIGSWNGRFQAVGGASASAGLNSISHYEMYAAVGQGYATISTNAGQVNNTRDLSGWALDENGWPNINILRNLASFSLGDEAVIGKSLINSFYGQEPLYSYFSGCSQGGRQGLMLAQRYPDMYDGIVASAPDINWGRLIPSRVWPQVVMNNLKEYPEGCELDYLGEAAIAACDELDGVKDGIISAMDKCDFDPFSHVGQRFNCSSTGNFRTLSGAAAKVANATWTGPRDDDGNFIWYGLNYGADISGDITGRDANAVTKCLANGTCVGEPLALGAQWLQYFASENDPSFDFAAMTIPEFVKLVNVSATKYGPIIGTDDPDLSAFKKAGGKIMGYHGLVSDYCSTMI